MTQFDDMYHVCARLIPITPLPSQFNILDISRCIKILTNYLSLWYKYVPLITSLIRKGFALPIIKETTNISGVKQNRRIITTQVCMSLIWSNVDPDLFTAFKIANAKLLYEIRLFSASQRIAVT
ncbi:Rubisco accumulation factor 2 [Spatholobus suberectus]|nr:Rubisco accumulation factor 2 [Spatholobus suberectus]